VAVLSQFVGAVLVTIGLALWSLPVAIIAAGVMIAVYGFLRELKSINEKESADGSREPSALDDPTRYS
jgi:cytochrome c-type biogenesis protein CcmH/NrfF